MEQSDRRRSSRVPVVSAWAECSSLKQAGRYAIENLSRGGALLRGPPLKKDTFIRVMLRLPDQLPLSVDAIVCREERQRQTERAGTAIEFGWLSDDEQDVIADVLSEYSSLAHSIGVLICTKRNWEGRALERSLKAIGFDPIRAKTPLATVFRLVADKTPVCAAVLGMNLDRATTQDILDFLAQYRPKIRRIKVGLPSEKDHFSANPLVHSYVQKPWTIEEMEMALEGLLPSDHPTPMADA